MEVATRTELLSAYAAGTTSPGLSLLCAAHLTLCPEGRAYVAGLDELGGALLCGEDADGGPPVAAPRLDAMLARLDDEETVVLDPVAQVAPACRSAAGPLPTPIARAANLPEAGVDALPWRFRLPGISEHTLAGFEQERVSLLRARPGARVLNHTHEGLEATLILAGAMKDGDRVLTAGDVALCGAEHDHHPEIVGDETCYCLIVVDGALRFTGTFARALNLFAE